MLESPIQVEISTEITECVCCGKRNLKRTICISSDDEEIGEMYLGVICASQWFKLNLTGNPYYAASKLKRHIDTLDNEELEQIINDIKEASIAW